MTAPKRISGSRFVTATLGLTFYRGPDGVVSAPIIASEAHQGPPGIAHGGFVATLLDEAMVAAAWGAGYPASTVNLTIDYRAPMPIDVEIMVRGWVERIEGRKIFTQATITRPDETIAAEGHGVFVRLPFDLPDADTPSGNIPFGIIE